MDQSDFLLGKQATSNREQINITANNAWVFRQYLRLRRAALNPSDIASAPQQPGLFKNEWGISCD
ncbi:hypothetical protein NOR53_2751 [gamma proteobacterium NOR5-3]|nr:hypothetical protein NOR53_2751 [gamma proteobacterium NOR5-3]